MAAPKFTPLDPIDRPRTYSSPEHVPTPWRNDRPSAITTSQPKGQKLGHQGPDQGYALKLAAGLSLRQGVGTCSGDEYVRGRSVGSTGVNFGAAMTRPA